MLASGDVVAVGDGRVGENTQDMSLQQGQTVLYNKFGIGTTDVSVKGTLHTLIREDDCIGIMPHSNATADDIPELKPAGDRVLLKVSRATLLHRAVLSSICTGMIRSMAHYLYRHLRTIFPYVNCISLMPRCNASHAGRQS